MVAGDGSWDELRRELARLRLDAGNPSLRELVAVGGRHSPGVSTISETLGGRRERISWEFVRFFVTACAASVARREGGDRSLPEADLRRWHARWRSAAAAAEAAADAVADAAHGVPAGSRRPAWNVEARNPAFVGRSRLLHEVHELLTRSGQGAPVVLHGLGGVGKTQVATEYAHAYADDYDVVWWVAAEVPGLLGGQFADLAAALDLAEAGTTQAAAAALAELRRSGRWLVVLDNTPSAEAVRGWLPAGRGHVLVTSRDPAWTGVAHPVAIDVLAREDAADLLRRYSPALGPAEAARLAEALGDLPLALAQAGGFLAQAGGTGAEFLDHLAVTAAEVLDEARPPGYPRSLAGTVRLSVAQLAGADPAAAHLLLLASFLAPEPIPAAVLVRPDRDVPGPAGPTSALGVARCIARIASYGLARPSVDGMLVHRLTQAVLRDLVPADEEPALRAEVAHLVATAVPDDADDPGTWPRWAALAPHVLAADPATTDDPDLRSAARHVVRYLLVRADARDALSLASWLLAAWQERLGPDHDDTLWTANQLGRIHHALGDYARAYELCGETYERRRRLYGEDHPETLVAASNVAVELWALGQDARAQEIDEDVLTRRRKVLGDRHPQTLLSMVNLAVDHEVQGRHEESRVLDEEAVAGYRAVLGEDHPDTLRATANLAGDYSALGRHEESLALYGDVVAAYRRRLGPRHVETLWHLRRYADGLAAAGRADAALELHTEALSGYREILGADHPDTLRAAAALAQGLRRAGLAREARELDADTLARRERVLGVDHPATRALAAQLVASRPQPSSPSR